MGGKGGVEREAGVGVGVGVGVGMTGLELGLCSEGRGCYRKGLRL